MLEYTDFGWWQAREEGSAVSLMPRAEPGGDNLWPWFSENSTMAEILELLGVQHWSSVTGDQFSDRPTDGKAIKILDILVTTDG
eukprot:Skav214966  [mRNA]  locus=scaffold124:132407:132658:+ [translate_table: standard]